MNNWINERIIFSSYYSLRQTIPKLVLSSIFTPSHIQEILPSKELPSPLLCTEHLKLSYLLKVFSNMMASFSDPLSIS